MRCYICNKETDNIDIEPDGKLVSICLQCLKDVKECNKRYEDIEESDIKLLKEKTNGTNCKSVRGR